MTTKEKIIAALVIVITVATMIGPYFTKKESKPVTKPMPVVAQKSEPTLKGPGYVKAMHNIEMWATYGAERPSEEEKEIDYGAEYERKYETPKVTKAPSDAERIADALDDIAWELFMLNINQR